MPFKGINWKEEIHNAIEMGEQGKSLQQIADHYGVSRQRINQVFLTYNVDMSLVGAKKSRKQLKEQREREYFAKWGEREDTDLYAAKRAKFYAKKANAKRVGWEWTVQFGEIEWPTHCPILGIELDYFAEFRQENSPSFDRIDPAKGYVPGNVVVMSWRANRIKNDGTIEEHQKIVEYLSNLTQGQ